MENKLQELKKNIKSIRYNILKLKEVEKIHNKTIIDFKDLLKDISNIENIVYQNKLFADKGIDRIVRRHDAEGKQGVIIFPKEWINKFVKITEVSK